MTVSFPTPGQPASAFIGWLPPDAPTGCDDLAHLTGGAWQAFRPQASARQNLRSRRWWSVKAASAQSWPLQARQAAPGAGRAAAGDRHRAMQGEVAYASPCSAPAMTQPCLRRRARPGPTPDACFHGGMLRGPHARLAATALTKGGAAALMLSPGSMRRPPAAATNALPRRDPPGCRTPSVCSRVKASARFEGAGPLPALRSVRRRAPAVTRPMRMLASVIAVSSSSQQACNFAPEWIPPTRRPVA